MCFISLEFNDPLLKFEYTLREMPRHLILSLFCNRWKLNATIYLILFGDVRLLEFICEDLHDEPLETNPPPFTSEIINYIAFRNL